MLCTSASGFRMEKAIAGIAPCVLFGGFSLPAQKRPDLQGRNHGQYVAKSPAEVSLD